MIILRLPHRDSASVLANSPRISGVAGLRLAGVTAAAALCALALPAVGIGDTTASAQTCWNGCDDRDERREIREDRQEVRRDEREIREDQHDIRNDIRNGDYDALQRDLRE